ncbi:basic leucine zipper 43-like [Humulus lupulus]|uniref:basic leucine zipper 43-like n=1 Tax=Humulus lupulus TaxID=3486 RepID=UPI002B40EB50|nr:basic leucine zipper 43-like [Humulus lupulus]
MESNNGSNMKGINHSPSQNSINSSISPIPNQKAPLFPGLMNRHAFEVLNLGHHSLPQQNPFFFTTTTSRLFPNPNESFSQRTSISSPGGGGSGSNGNDSAATDDINNVEMTERNRREGANNSANDTRRLKRMISNRESARRSRMRRKMQIEELQYLVSQLQTTNRQLSEKLIQLLDSNQQIVQENSQLKEKVSSLQIILSDLLVPVRNIAGEDSRAQLASTTPSATVSSMQLLH